MNAIKKFFETLTYSSGYENLDFLIEAEAEVENIRKIIDIRKKKNKRGLSYECFGSNDKIDIIINRLNQDESIKISEFP
jgi:hypothetical protein